MSGRKRRPDGEGPSVDLSAFDPSYVGRGLPCDRVCRELVTSVFTEYQAPKLGGQENANTFSE